MIYTGGVNGDGVKKQGGVYVIRCGWCDDLSCRASLCCTATIAMFKLPSLPQAIGLPFLSETEDAQLKFKTGPNGVKRLSGAEVIPRSDVAYWAQWYTVFPSPDHVYSLLGAHDIRHALHANPANVATLVHHVAHHLFTLVPSPLFPHPPSATAAAAQDLTKEALNCLRVLGRVLSVVYEAEGEVRDGGAESFAAQYLWNRQEAPPAEHFTIQDSDSDDGDDARHEPELDTGARAFRATIGHPPSPPHPQPISDPLTQPHESGDHRDSGGDGYMPSLAERLFSCTIDLLFCAGFTLPQTVSEDENDKINVCLCLPPASLTRAVRDLGKRCRQHNQDWLFPRPRPEQD